MVAVGGGERGAWCLEVQWAGEGRVPMLTALWHVPIRKRQGSKTTKTWVKIGNPEHWLWLCQSLGIFWRKLENPDKDGP